MKKTLLVAGFCTMFVTAAALAEWTAFRFSMSTDPITDEVTYYVVAEDKTFSKSMLIVLGCTRNLPMVGIHDGVFRIAKDVKITVRFDKNRPTVMEGKVVSRGVGIFRNGDVQAIAYGLSRSTEMAFRIDGGSAIVLPLTGAKDAMKKMRKVCKWGSWIITD